MKLTVTAFDPNRQANVFRVLHEYVGLSVREAADIIEGRCGLSDDLGYCLDSVKLRLDDAGATVEIR